MKKGIVTFLLLIGQGLCEDLSETKLTADQVECNQQTQTCVASGNARVERGEMNEKKVLTAHTITAHMKNSRADRIEAEGNVVLTTSEGEIHADVAHYAIGEEKVEFLHNVSIHQGEAIMKGEAATGFLKEGVFRMSGGKDQVRGLMKMGSKS